MISRFKLSVQYFQKIILIYRRVNFVSHHRKYNFINHPLIDLLRSHFFKIPVKEEHKMKLFFTNIVSVEFADP